VQVVPAGGLLGEQLAVPFVEVGEVVVAPVGDRGREVGAVRPLEGEQRRPEVRPEAFEDGRQ
jgi:hypothetical protein